MNSDDKVMFFEMMAEDAALLADAEENEMIMAALLEAAVEEDAAPKFGGSSKGRRPNKNRNRATGHALLFQDYFAENPTNLPHEFRRRFRMSRTMFGGSCTAFGTTATTLR